MDEKQLAKVLFEYMEKNGSTKLILEHSRSDRLNYVMHIELDWRNDIDG